MARVASPAIETHPLTPDRWRDFAALMNSRYDVRRCWCMAPRLSYSYKRHTGDENRRAIKKVVDTAIAPPGVLAYVDGQPSGWCAVAPRAEFPRYERSRSAEQPESGVWSVVCFYVLRSARRGGVSRALLTAAVELARSHGARAVEGYPVEGTRNPYRGFPSLFRSAGFREVQRTSNRIVVRRDLKPAKQAPPARASKPRRLSRAGRLQ